jgi:hypothetical protein
MNDQDKKEKAKEEKRISISEEENKVKECPHCHTVNESDARFCAECGYDFAGARRCPKCGAKIVSPNADICEECGEWLLEGKCKFCYADIEEGQTYCPECGNPVAGIVCPQCGRLSYFDFCKYCNIPLTATAKKMQEEIKNNPAEQELLNLLESYTPVKSKGISPDEDELLKMKEYIEKVNKKEKKKKVSTPLFSEKQKENIKALDQKANDEIQRREEEKRRREEEQRKQEEEQKKLQLLLTQMRNVKFTTNQDARRYFSVRRPRGAKGWLCNCCSVLHDSPSDCGDPSQGGTWII